MTTAKTTKRIEVLRPGSFTPTRGGTVTFSADDLRQIAASYDQAAPAPAVVGHPQLDAPAYGWATAFAYDEASERLVAELDQVEPAFADAVAEGRYRKVSMALFEPQASNNPKPGSWYPKHIGFLGAAAPAVSGLKPVQFADGDKGSIVIELGNVSAFGDTNGFRDVASALRSMRDWMIAKFGLEAADSALSTWAIDWIDDAASRNPPAPSQPATFSAPLPTTNPEPTMPQPLQNAAELEKREAALAAREAEINHRDNVAFAESLLDQGRLIPASRDKLVALLDVMAAPTHEPMTVTFSEGNTEIRKAAADMVRELLAAQPKVITFGEHAKGPAPSTGVATFAAADNRTVDSERLDLHNRALAYQRAHPSVDYIAAVRAVDGGA